MATCTGWGQVDTGVLVEKVASESEASRAGLIAGDIISSWKQGHSGGSLNSTFDLLGAERERGPRGSVSLEGTRLSSPMHWTLNATTWGILATPRWHDTKEIHEHMLELARLQRFTELEDYCRFACLTVAEPEKRAWAFFEAATWLASNSSWGAADEFYEKATSVARLEPHGVAPQMALDQWGETYLQRGDIKGAEKCFTRALGLNKANDPESLSVAYDLLEMSLLKYRQSRFSEAADYARQSLVIRRVNAPESLDTARTWNTLGASLLQSGDLDAADGDFHKALDLARRVNPNGREASFAYNNLGAVSVAQGDLSKAEDYFLRDLEITRALNPHDYLLSYSWTNLGAVALQRASMARARRYFENALAIQEAHNRQADIAKSLHNLAFIAADRNEMPEAEVLLRRALKIQEPLATNRLDLAQTADTLGSVLRRERRYIESLDLLGRALQLRRMISGESLSVAETLCHLGEVHLDQREFNNADQELRQAAAIQKSLAPDSYLLAKTLAGLARLASLRNDPVSAVQNYSDAIDVLDRQSGMLGGSGESDIHFHEQYADYYRELVSLLLSQGDANRAFETLERSRAQTLLRMLAEGDIVVHGGASRSLIENDRRLSRRISDLAETRWRLTSAFQSESRSSQLSAKIADLLNEREEVRAQMRDRSPQYSALTLPSPAHLYEVQRQLDNDTLLLEYSLGRSKSYLFAITKGSMDWFELSPRERLESSAKVLYRKLSAHDESGDNIATLETDLGALILLPAMKLIQQHHQLVIVADGALNYVPFAVLQVGKSGRMLLSDHEIAKCPSATFLIRSKMTAGRNVQYLYDTAILADPVFSGDDPRIGHPRVEGSQSDVIRGETMGLLSLPRLFESRKEALAIRTMFRHGRAFTALDFDASKRTMGGQAVRSSRIVHLSTHGLFDAQNPQLSGLVFSLFDKNGEYKTGFYGLEDIFHSDIRAQLVVLSGCQTTLGEEVDGEGFLGITWGFLYAGARTVMSSLWTVDDASTASLMTEFYKGMIQERLTPPGALRFAQLQISKQPKWSDPFYWAGFTLDGDWHRVTALGPRNP